MARWKPDARSRLAAAALDLYAERGFDATTVAEIAERAGLTKRTFFRHYADKREVLFSGSEELEAVIVGGVRGAPAGTAPLDAVLAGLDAAAPFFAERAAGHARRRQAIIDANPELQERELIKMARLTSAVTGALRERGVGDPAAELTAAAGLAVFSSAFARWAGHDGDADLGSLIHQGAKELRSVALA